MQNEITIFWFRRDLRLTDNHGLYRALDVSKNVLPIFIFDIEILSQLENKEDKRIDFIFQTLNTINQYLEKKGKSIKIFYGIPLEIFKELANYYLIENVFCNEDYEPSAIKRDDEIEKFLTQKKINFKQFKDQVHFHKNDILKSDGNPYTIYTPYSNKWLLKYREQKIENYPSEKHLQNLTNVEKQNITLEKIGFKKTNYEFESPKLEASILKKCHETRINLERIFYADFISFSESSK